MINAKRIEEMKRLSAEVSEGPWLYIDDSNVVISVSEEYVPEICEGFNTTYNAQFIAKSRQFVPDIIAAYEEQAKEIDKQRLELRCSSDVQTGVIKKQAEEIARLRNALTSIQSDCESAKKYYVEESDIDGILETVREALQNGD